MLSTVNGAFFRKEMSLPSSLSLFRGGAARRIQAEALETELSAPFPAGLLARCTHLLLDTWNHGSHACIQTAPAIEVCGFQCVSSVLDEWRAVAWGPLRDQIPSSCVVSALVTAQRLAPFSAVAVSFILLDSCPGRVSFGVSVSSPGLIGLFPDSQCYDASISKNWELSLKA